MSACSLADEHGSRPIAVIQGVTQNLWVKILLSILTGALAGSTALVGCVVGGVLSFAVWSLLPDSAVRAPIAAVIFFVAIALVLLLELRDRR